MAAFPTTNINLSNVNQAFGFLTAPYNFTNLRGRILYNSQGNTFTTPTSGPISFDDFKGQLYAVNAGMYDRVITNTSSRGAAQTNYANVVGIQTYCVSDSFEDTNNSRSIILFSFKADPSTYTQTRRLTVTFYHRVIDNYGAPTKSRFDKILVNNNEVFLDDTVRYGEDGDFTNTYSQILTNNTFVSFGDFVRVEMYLDGFGGTRWDNTTTVSITNA